MRVVLVAIHPYPSPQAVPLANAFLQSYLTTLPFASQLQVQRQDFYLDEPQESCLSRVLALEPDLVAFSVYVWNRGMCRELAQGISQALPAVVLVAGGPEVTADPAGVLAESPYGFLITGEGELPFGQACQRLLHGADLEGIPGVVTRQGGHAPAAPLEELDSIPSPWLSGILDSTRHRGILWQLSRGCGFACDFCFDARGVRGVRRFSLERLEAELRHFATTSVSQVFVLDSTFNQNQRRAKAILRMIGKQAPHIHFHFEVRSEFLDREMSDLFAGLACSLQIGLQSADPQVMRGVGRSFDRKDFCARIDLLNRSGAIFGFDLIYGLPGDTLAGFGASLDFALALYPNHLDIFPLAVLPGTALAKRSSANQLRHLTEPPYTLLSSPTFSEHDMQQARRLATACDVFYTRGKGVAWFNSVCSALKLRPSQLLEQFADHLDAGQKRVSSESELTDGEIHQLQRVFLTGLFQPPKLRRLLPLVLDLVDYHFHYAAALQTPPPPLPDEEQLLQADILNRGARLADSTQLAVFNHEILDILEAGEPDLRSFTAQSPRSGSWAAIYPASDGVRTESLIEPYFRLLERLDGSTPCGTIAAKLGVLPEDAHSFLEFALAEGLILPCP